MLHIPVDAFLSLKDGTVMSGCESGMGGGPPARVNRLQFILAFILPLQVIDPQADLKKDKGRSHSQV